MDDKKYSKEEIKEFLKALYRDGWLDLQSLIMEDELTTEEFNEWFNRKFWYDK